MVFLEDKEFPTAFSSYSHHGIPQPGLTNNVSFYGHNQPLNLQLLIAKHRLLVPNVRLRGGSPLGEDTALEWHRILPDLRAFRPGVAQRRQRQLGGGLPGFGTTSGGLRRTSAHFYPGVFWSLLAPALPSLPRREERRRREQGLGITACFGIETPQSPSWLGDCRSTTQ